MKHALVLATILIATTTAAAAEPLHISIDTDPTTYPLGGFSGWVMVKPSPHVRVGVGGFGLDFPSFLLSALDRGTSDGDGWSFGVRGAMAFAGYQFGDRRGLYVGAYTGYLQTRYGRDEMTTTENHVTVLPSIGYQWFPFGNGALEGVYLQPWAGVITWFGGSSTIAGETFKDPLFIPIAAAHVGYEF